MNPVCSAAIGRQFRTGAPATRGSSTSFRVTTTRAATSPAAMGSLFAPFKGSSNSEHKRAHPILQFFPEHPVTSIEKREGKYSRTRSLRVQDAEITNILKAI